MKTVTAIEHEGRLYANQDELADDIVRQRFMEMVKADPLLGGCYSGAGFAAYTFIRKNEDAILKLLGDRYSGRLIEELRKT